MKLFYRSCPHCGQKSISPARICLSDLFGGAARCASCGKLSGHGAFARSMFALACGGMVFSFAAAAMPDKYLQLYGFLAVLT